MFRVLIQRLPHVRAAPPSRVCCPTVFVEDMFAPMQGGLIKIDDPLTGSYSKPPVLKAGGSGLVSTVADYGTFLQMLINQGSWGGAAILQPASGLFGA